MLKIWVIILSISFGLVGCKGIDHGMIDNEGFVDINEEYLTEKLYINDTQISDFIKLSKEKILDKLGSDYEIVYERDGCREGYFWPEDDTVIFFNEENVPDIIECGKNVNLAGIRLDMAVSEVKSILGEGELIALRMGGWPFALVYRFENFSLWLMLTDEDGKVVGTDIYCFR